MPRGVYPRKKTATKKLTTKSATAVTHVPEIVVKARASSINPKHYGIVVNGQSIQVVDLIEAIYPEDAHMSQALKYMLRAGRKNESSFVQDIQKCIWWLIRALMFQKVKSIEVPKGAPIHGKD